MDRSPEHRGTRPITNDELFALDVDVLVLAAMEGQITADNAGTVRAKIVAEAANGPVTPESGSDPGATTAWWSFPTSCATPAA